jgi:hypothetical protein
MIVRRMYKVNPDLAPVEQEFSHKVGGFLGIAEDTINGNMEVSRDVFMSGEEMKIAVTTDFSKVK